MPLNRLFCLDGKLEQVDPIYHLSAEILWDFFWYTEKLMNPKEAFGVAVRVTGLWMALYGAYSLVWSIVSQIVIEGSRFTPSFYLGYGVILCLIGILLLRRGEAVVRFAYPENRHVG